jgi:hypothetical protein
LPCREREGEREGREMRRERGRGIDGERGKGEEERGRERGEKVRKIN